MTIELHTAPILLEVRQKSHLEVQDIKDPEVRDNARAGLDKLDEIKRCVEEGYAQARRKCMRFLLDEHTSYADDSTSDDQYKVYELDLSERRAIGRADVLASTLHTLVVQYALAKFYASVNQPELSNKHSLLALDAGNQIDELLYFKKPPRV